MATTPAAVSWYKAVKELQKKEVFKISIKALTIANTNGTRSAYLTDDNKCYSTKMEPNFNSNTVYSPAYLQIIWWIIFKCYETTKLQTKKINVNKKKEPATSYTFWSGRSLSSLLELWRKCWAQLGELAALSFMRDLKTRITVLTYIFFLLLCTTVTHCQRCFVVRLAIAIVSCIQTMPTLK